MPLFFFLAGVFLVSTLEKRGYAGWVLDKAQYLLYPWLVWSLLRGLLEVGLFQFGIGAPISIQDVILGVVWDPVFGTYPRSSSRSRSSGEPMLSPEEGDGGRSPRSRRLSSSSP